MYSPNIIIGGKGGVARRKNLRAWGYRRSYIGLERSYFGARGVHCARTLAAQFARDGIANSLTLVSPAA